MEVAMVEAAREAGVRAVVKWAVVMEVEGRAAASAAEERVEEAMEAGEMAEAVRVGEARVAGPAHSL